MDLYFILACMVIQVVVLVAVNAKALGQVCDTFAVTLSDVTGRAAAERRDLLDRLMARDLTEVKSAQRLEGGDGPRVVSKRDNEERKAKEAQHIAERGN